jgi:MFS family permease
MMAASESSISNTTRASQLDIEKTSKTTGNGQDGTANEPRREVTGFRWFLVCVAIFSANLLYGLDTTIAADIQASVSETFDNVTQLGWLGVGFTLGSTVAILPLGKAYAIFNTKWVFISCLTMFAAGSALCGSAPSMNAIIVGRVWAGTGGAGMYLGYAKSSSSVVMFLES